MAKKLTIATINRGWPHQVALQASSNDNLAEEQSLFCKRLLRCAEILSVTDSGQAYNVHCFATREGASAFMSKFGGEWFDPTERGRGAFADRWTRKAAKRPG